MTNHTGMTDLTIADARRRLDSLVNEMCGVDGLWLEYIEARDRFAAAIKRHAHSLSTAVDLSGRTPSEPEVGLSAFVEELKSKAPPTSPGPDVSQITEEGR